MRVALGKTRWMTPNAGNTTPATVSLIGLNAVDLDGSTGYGHSPAGVLVSNVSFAPGNYTVTFALAGNLRGNVAQTTLFGFETNAPGVITAPSSQPYTWYSETFFDASGPLIFEDLGPSDQQGNLLADVTLSVPEASTWAMMTLGFAALGFAAYRKARPAVSIA
jgi:hypothetical protein